MESQSHVAEQIRSKVVEKVRGMCYRSPFCDEERCSCIDYYTQNPQELDIRLTFEDKLGRWAIMYESTGIARTFYLPTGAIKSVQRLYPGALFLTEEQFEAFSRKRKEPHA